MEYNRVNWKDYPDVSTKLNAENLNVMDKGIADCAEEIEQLNSKTPFSFAIDADGNYGYIKDGADSVTPFNSDNYLVYDESEGCIYGKTQKGTLIKICDYKGSLPIYSEIVSIGPCSAVNNCAYNEGTGLSYPRRIFTGNSKNVDFTINGYSLIGFFKGNDVNGEKAESSTISFSGSTITVNDKTDWYGTLSGNQSGSYPANYVGNIYAIVEVY